MLIPFAQQYCFCGKLSFLLVISEWLEQDVIFKHDIIAYNIYIHQYNSLHYLHSSIYIQAVSYIYITQYTS